MNYRDVCPACLRSAHYSCFQDYEDCRGCGYRVRKGVVKHPGYRPPAESKPLHTLLAVRRDDLGILLANTECTTKNRQAYNEAKERLIRAFNGEPV